MWQKASPSSSWFTSIFSTPTSSTDAAAIASGGLPRRNDLPRESLAKSFRIRLSRGGRFHYPRRLGADGSDRARADAGSISWGMWYRARFLRLYPMYWLRTSRLPGFAVRRSSRAGRRPNRPEPARAALHRYHDELHVPQRRLVVFSMLIQFYLLFPIFFWAARNLGPWPFLLLACAIGFPRPLLDARLLSENGFWILGGCAICRLPEFALGMTLGMWHSQSAARIEKFPAGGAGIISWTTPLSRRQVWLYHSGYTYTFVDLATGACALLVILGRRRNHFAVSRARRKFSLWWDPSLMASTSCTSPMHLARAARP